jgi:hypothetical protein
LENQEIQVANDFFDFFIYEDRIGVLLRKAGKKLKLYAAEYPRREQILVRGIGNVTKAIT